MFYAFFVVFRISFFFLLAGRFSIGCGSKFRAEVAYLEVGSSDFEQIHEKTIFDDFSSFVACLRRPSAKNPGGKRPSKILKVCFWLKMIYFV